MTALTRQIAGTHYKGMAIQPVVFSMVNGLDACAHSTLKYVSRHMEKGGRADLEKAFHFLELRDQLFQNQHIIENWVVRMPAFCQANDLPREEAGVLNSLAVWLESPVPLHLTILKDELSALIELRYPQTTTQESHMNQLESNGSPLSTARQQLEHLIFTETYPAAGLYNTVVPAANGLEFAQGLCHFLASNSGWWTDLATGQRKTRDQVNVPEKLMLIVSEVSEAMEGVRKDLMDDKLPHRKMLEVELADALIRILDLAGFLELDISGAVIEKLVHNQQRADHRIGNRLAEGGKQF